MLWTRYMRIQPPLMNYQGAFTAAAHTLSILGHLPSNANFNAKIGLLGRESTAQMLADLSTVGPIAVVRPYACDPPLSREQCRRSVKSSLHRLATSLTVKGLKQQAAHMAAAAERLFRVSKINQTTAL
eukprot:gnl/TRDRNA2_/TRDRNA2_37851_c0_seq2.p1 gnl/TRDRNA2_/TRDRNA2_37851_c0~~gnl/TRDRNA2_/TRDRNA2_37851_c0_seq2.p1  ORF type:complete len:128 (+),score=2.25 gnl/TRDRNA2_/TRDRNA2_37851_c0_seq2:312-695(+)